MSGAITAQDDPHAFLAALAAAVEKVIPTATIRGLLSIDRERSLGDRLAGRPGAVTGLRLATSAESLSVGYSAGPVWKAEIARVSGGVIISRRSLPLGEWLTAFAGRVAAAAADDAGDAAASATALQTLGIGQAGADIRVDEATLDDDLRALPARLTGRVADGAVQAIQRIAELLSATLPRVADSGEAEIIVRRTATTYLPDTVRTYLSLPADWVASHRFADGTTPQQAFLTQLATIEKAARTMHDSAVEQDATALLANGRFLSSRFATSSLDLQ